MTPVSVFNVKPSGSFPPLIDHLYGDVPFEALIVAVNAALHVEAVGTVPVIVVCVTFSVNFFELSPAAFSAFTVNV